jgi:FkbM family methyltransferase
MYWEGDVPAWINACQRTVFAHAPDVRLLGPADFDALRDCDRDIDLSRLCSAHRADFLRAFLLARFGGIWIDSDCIVLRSLSPVLDLLDEHTFVGYQERQGHAANNFMGAPRGSRIAAAYYERLCGILRSDQKLSWLSLGSDALTQTLRDLSMPWHRLGYELVQPICWSNPAAFFAVADPADHERTFNGRSICYMLSNNMVRGFSAANPSCELMNPRSFFSYLLGKASLPSRAEESCGSRPAARDWRHLAFCAEAIADVSPSRVLDANVGFGRWGMLVREVCEDAQGRPHRESWRGHLEGIQPSHADVAEYHHLLYNWIHVGAAAEIIGRMSARWELIILGDALKDQPADVASAALARALSLADYVLLSPRPGEPMTVKPLRHGADSGQGPGVCLLSVADPRRLRTLVRHFRTGTDDTRWIIPELVHKDMFRADHLAAALRGVGGEILDCGAHIGVFSALLASRGVRQTIHAFEPEPRNFELLVRNARDYPGIIPIPQAVGTRDGSAALYDGGDTGRWSLVQRHDPPGLPVTVVNLYRYIREVGHVALIKLDLEGYEAPLLNQMPDDVLERIYILITEEHDLPIDHARLRSAGFTVWFEPWERHRVYRAPRPWAVPRDGRLLGE